jgi:hypothetical protein
LQREEFTVYQPTDKEIRQWRRYRKTRRRWDYREGRIEPWCACEVCQRWYPNKERVDWRTVWCEETGEDLSTRKVRDLNARLKLYRYGDHHWQPEKMREVTARRKQETFVAIPHTPRFYWPDHEADAYFTEGIQRYKEKAVAFAGPVALGPFEHYKTGDRLLDDGWGIIDHSKRPEWKPLSDEHSTVDKAGFHVGPWQEDVTRWYFARAELRPGRCRHGLALGMCAICKEEK